jgi:hypothetical protein
MAYNSRENAWRDWIQRREKWPPHWQGVIYKAYRIWDSNIANFRYCVQPKNPEYDKFMEALSMVMPNDFLPIAPCPHLGPVAFDSIEDIDTWAKVLWRMR